MGNETAMEYLSDIANFYLSFIPVNTETKAEIKKAIYLGIGALKTLQDMKCNSASVYGSSITKGE